MFNQWQILYLVLRLFLIRSSVCLHLRSSFFVRSGSFHFLALLPCSPSATPFCLLAIMPPKPKRSTAASAGPTKRPKTILEALLSTDEQVLNSLKAQHKGKRLLLKADALYGKSRVPRGEENYNFLYIVQDINPGGKEAVTNLYVVARREASRRVVGLVVRGFLISRVTCHSPVVLN